MAVVRAKIQTVEDILPASLGRCSEQASHRGQVSRATPVVLSSSLGSDKAGKPRVLCYQYGGDSESGLEPEGSPANWRCVALEKLSKVKL